MNAWSHRNERADGFRVEQRSFGVLLRRDADLFERVSREEGVTSLVLLASPVERGFKHAQVPPNRVGSDATACRAPVAPPYHVVVNAIRRELAHQLTAPEKLLEIPTRLPKVLQIALGLQRPVRGVAALRRVPGEERFQSKGQGRAITPYALMGCLESCDRFVPHGDTSRGGVMGRCGNVC